MAAFSLSFSAVNLISQSKNQLSLYSTNSQGAGHTNVDPCYSGWRNKNCQKRTRTKPCGFRVFAATEGSAKSKESEETIPSWARPDSDEPPPWARGEGKVELKQGFNVPFYVYLLASAVTAIAATGSVFEYVNQRPIFGVLNSDSVFYAPVLGFFAFTGIPTSAFLWYKSVQVANKEAEEQDKRDGYR